jgi:hypothetical protein
MFLIERPCCWKEYYSASQLSNILRKRTGSKSFELLGDLAKSGKKLRDIISAEKHEYFLAFLPQKISC